MSQGYVENESQDEFVSTDADGGVVIKSMDVDGGGENNYQGLVHFITLPDTNGTNNSWAIEACTLNSVDQVIPPYSNQGDKTPLVTLAGDVNLIQPFIKGSRATNRSFSKALEAEKMKESVSFASMDINGANPSEVNYATAITPYGVVVSGKEGNYSIYRAGSIVTDSGTLSLPDLKGAKKTIATTDDIPSSVPAKNIAGTLDIAQGGTGATTADGARTKLGLGGAATSKVVDYKEDIVTELDDATDHEEAINVALPTADVMKAYVKSKIDAVVTSAVDYLGTAVVPQELAKLGESKHAQSGDMVRSTGDFKLTIPATTTEDERKELEKQTSDYVSPGDMIIYIGDGTNYDPTTSNWRSIHTEADKNTWSKVSTASDGIVPKTVGTGPTDKLFLGSIAGSATWGLAAFTGTKVTITPTVKYDKAKASAIETAVTSASLSSGTLPSFSARYEASSKNLILSFNKGAMPTLATTTASVVSGIGHDTISATVAGASYTPTGEIDFVNHVV